MPQFPHILAVCTGNICRSPVIERLLARELGPRGVHVSSAGTGAVVGAAIWEPMATLLTQAGGDADGFAARPLTVPLIRDATMILTATTAHRRTIVDIAPAAMKRTFTLLEFAQSLHLLQPEDLAELLREASESTSSAPTEDNTTVVTLTALKNHALRSRPRLRLPADAQDLPDPYRHSEAVCRSVFASIHQATTTIARAVTHVDNSIVVP